MSLRSIYKSYKVDLVNKKVTLRPRVTVVLGYKDSYTNYFDTDQQAQAYVDDLIAKSKKEFPSNNWKIRVMDLFELIDHAIANELGVNLETYVDVIENKCTVEEADFIIDQLFREDGDVEAAKQMFNSKLKQ